MQQSQATQLMGQMGSGVAPTRQVLLPAKRRGSWRSSAHQQVAAADKATPFFVLRVRRDHLVDYSLEVNALEAPTPNRE